MLTTKPYEFQVAAGFSQPSRDSDDEPVSVDTIVWGGHFREDEDDDLGLQLAILNQRSEQDDGTTTPT